MIPKIIHYCWLSKEPIPNDLLHCMETWEKVLPNYEFILWDFNRFPKNKSQWVSDAFDRKKYAFAADYIRLYSVYHYGGIYLDMDVEVLKPFDALLNNDLMLGWQFDKDGIEIAAFGAERHSPIIKQFLDYYEKRHFIRDDGTLNMMVMPVVINALCKDLGYTFVDIKDEKEYKIKRNEKTIPLYPPSFFSPKSYVTGRIHANETTYSIHNFKGSWTDSAQNTTLYSILHDFYVSHIMIILKKWGLYKIIWYCTHPFSKRRFPEKEKALQHDSTYYLK